MCLGAQLAPTEGDGGARAADPRVDAASSPDAPRLRLSSAARRLAIDAREILTALCLPPPGELLLLRGDNGRPSPSSSGLPVALHRVLCDSVRPLLPWLRVAEAQLKRCVRWGRGVMRCGPARCRALGAIRCASCAPLRQPRLTPRAHSTATLPLSAQARRPLSPPGRAATRAGAAVVRADAAATRVHHPVPAPRSAPGACRR